MSILSRFKESQIGQFWLVYEQKIILAIGIILIAAISFEAGFLKGQQNKNEQEPIIVNKVAAVETARLADESGLKTNTTQTKNENTSSPATDNPARIASQSDAGGQKCAFVASKNSNKYHLPTCRYAQNIKPENKVCFSSKEEAEGRGFQSAKCCIK
jgi:hypothetical protein